MIDIYFLKSGGWKSIIKVPFGFQELSSWIVKAVCSCSLSSIRVHLERKGASSLVSLKDTNPIKSGLHPSELIIISLEAHLQI